MLSNIKKTWLILYERDDISGKERFFGNFNQMFGRIVKSEVRQSEKEGLSLLKEIEIKDNNNAISIIL